MEGGRERGREIRREGGRESRREGRWGKRVKGCKVSKYKHKHK